MWFVSSRLSPQSAILHLPAPALQTLTPLYNNNGSILATFLRIDIPKLPHFDQYNYVLFTGVCMCFAQQACACACTCWFPTPATAHSVDVWPLPSMAATTLQTATSTSAST